MWTKHSAAAYLCLRYKVSIIWKINQLDQDYHKINPWQNQEQDHRTSISWFLVFVRLFFFFFTMTRGIFFFFPINFYFSSGKSLSCVCSLMLYIKCTGNSLCASSCSSNTLNQFRTLKTSGIFTQINSVSSSCQPEAGSLPCAEYERCAKCSVLQCGLVRAGVLPGWFCSFCISSCL